MNAVENGRKLRELRGTTPQQEVADACGVTKMAISQYESGARVPRDEIKVRIAKYYGVSVESLFFTEEEGKS